MSTIANDRYVRTDFLVGMGKFSASTYDSDVKDCIRKAQRGDTYAAEVFIRKHNDLIKKTAKQFSYRGSDFEDLCSVGNIALLKFIEQYDCDSNSMVFSAILQRLKTDMRRYANADKQIHIAVNSSENRNKLFAVIERLTAENKESVTIERLIAETNFPKAMIERLIGVELGTVSMQSETDDDEGNGSEFSNTIADDSPTPYESIEKSDDMRLLTVLLSKLTDTERTIIELYYGIGCEKRTLSEIANIMGKTAESIRQKIDKILIKMRNNA